MNKTSTQNTLFPSLSNRTTSRNQMFLHSRKTSMGTTSLIKKRSPSKRNTSSIESQKKRLLKQVIPMVNFTDLFTRKAKNGEETQKRTPNKFKRGRRGNSVSYQKINTRSLSNSTLDSKFVGGKREYLSFKDTDIVRAKIYRDKSRNRNREEAKLGVSQKIRKFGSLSNTQTGFLSYNRKVLPLALERKSSDSQLTESKIKFKRKLIPSRQSSFQLESGIYYTGGQEAKEKKYKMSKQQSIFLEIAGSTKAGIINNIRKTNQDAWSSHSVVVGGEDTCLIAVFDGHGAEGHKCSNFLKSHLKSKIIYSSFVLDCVRL